MRLGSAATRYSGSRPPMTATSPMPGIPRSRVRRSYSAISRISSADAPPSLPVSATSMISPVTETMGEISAWASSGKVSLTRARRSNTSKRARATSTFQSKSIQTNESPPLELERMVDTPGIPFTTDSMGIVTSCSTSSAVSPPASVWMVTRGTEMSGNTSTARFCHVRSPIAATISVAARIVFGLSAIALNIRFILGKGIRDMRYGVCFAAGLSTHGRAVCPQTADEPHRRRVEDNAPYQGRAFLRDRSVASGTRMDSR